MVAPSGCSQMWITPSEVSSKLRAVSLWLPSLRRPTLSMTVGGSLLTAPKKLKGARLVIPSPLMVEIQQMGRGITEETISRYRSLRSSWSGSRLRCEADIEVPSRRSLLTGLFDAGNRTEWWQRSILLRILDGCKGVPLTIDEQQRTIAVEER
jgi:hypothetical protein